MTTEWQTTRITIRERNQYMYNNAMFSDVQFSVVMINSKGDRDTVTVPAHKYVLAISSPVFQAMFYGEMAETQRTIDLPDCTAEGLLELFRYMYYDEVQLTGSHVMEVLYLSKKYIVPSLVKKCIQYLEEEMGPEDVFNILPQAKKLEDETLKQLCWKIVDTETQRAVTSEAFLDVTQDVLCEVLERDTLTISEVELFKVVHCWATKNIEEQGLTGDGKAKRNALGDKAIHLIRFPIMSQKVFADVILDTGILNLEEVTELIKHFNGVLSSPRSFVTKTRKCKLICKRVTKLTGTSLSSSTFVYIMLTVNKEVHLSGVRLYGNRNSHHTVQLIIQRRRDGSVLYRNAKPIPFASDAQEIDGYYGFTFPLDTPILLVPGTEYFLDSYVCGDSFVYGEGARNVVECEGVTFAFKKESRLVNGQFTNSVEQFPELQFFLR